MTKWKQLAPRPYSSLWLWCGLKSCIGNSGKQCPQDQKVKLDPWNKGYRVSVVEGKDTDTVDCLYSVFAAPEENSPDESNMIHSDDQPDWLDISIASVDQNESLKNCIIYSSPTDATHLTQSVGLADSVNNSVSNSVISDNSGPSEGESDLLEDGLGSGGPSSIKKRKSSAERAKTSKRKQSPHHSALTSDQINLPPKVQNPAQGTNTDEIMKIVEISENKSLIILKKSPQLFFSFSYGEMKVTTIAGHIKLDGYAVKTGEQVPISCGFGNYQILVSLSQYANFPSSKHLNEMLTVGEVPESFHEEIYKYLQNDQGPLSESIIIRLEKWRSPWLASLRRLVKPESTMTNHWFRISFSDIKSPIVQWPHIVSDLVADIKQITSRLNGQTNPKILVCGGSDAGKSSLYRHLANQFIGAGYKTVYVVDCDPGQVEFTPPGLISFVKLVEPVLSPPFVNCLRYHKSVVMSSSVGSVSPGENPDIYLINFLHLWKTFLEKVESPAPILLNTMGWTSGIGVYLLVDIIKTVQPTHLIEIKRLPFDGKVNFPFDCTPEMISSLTGWSANVRQSTQDYKQNSSNILGSIPERVEFSYITLSSFHKPHREHIRPNRLNRINNQLAYFCRMDELIFKSISDIKCIELDTKNLFFHVENEYPIESHLIPESIRNSWVHLCVVKNPVAKHSKSGSLPTNNAQRRTSNLSANTDSGSSLNQPNHNPQEKSSYSMVLANCPSNLPATPTAQFDNLCFKVLSRFDENVCIGSAVVRNIDLRKCKIFLLTPESSEKLNQVNCIVRPSGFVVPHKIQ